MLKFTFGVNCIASARRHSSYYATAGQIPQKSFRQSKHSRNRHSNGPKIQFNAAKQGISDEATLKKVLEEKSREFQEKGADLYAKA